MRHLTPIICHDKRRGLREMLRKEQGLLLLNELRLISGSIILRDVMCCEEELIITTVSQWLL